MVPATERLSIAFITTNDRDIKGMTQVRLSMPPIVVINAKSRDIGGFPVRRALPAIERRMVGPFIFLDQMGPTRLAPGQRLDVRPHPHIGLSTMTYLLAGEILHRDSLGTVQMIRPGAINWMTAGSGIAHSERTPKEIDAGGTLSGIQFWVALPKSHEEMAPAFLHLEANALPVLDERNVSARVIAGEAFGVRSSLDAPHPMICVDIAMAAGGHFELPADYEEQALYMANGEIELGGVRYGEGQLLILPNKARCSIRAISGARLMLLGGEPMDGPRHIWWNFVSSSKDRIEQAKQDWKLSRFPEVPGETEYIPLPE
jgi:redox-sensitive bicupin YhaK (pirin superfamily)